MLKSILALYYVLSTSFCMIHIWDAKDNFKSHMAGVILLIIGWIALPFYVIHLLINKNMSEIKVDSFYVANTKKDRVIKVCYFVAGDKEPKDIQILEEDYLEWVADNNLDGEVDGNDWSDEEMDFAPSKVVLNHEENMYENLSMYIKQLQDDSDA